MSKGNFLSLQISEEEILQAAHLTNKKFKIISNLNDPNKRFILSLIYGFPVGILVGLLLGTLIFLVSVYVNQPLTIDEFMRFTSMWTIVFVPSSIIIFFHYYKDKMNNNKFIALNQHIKDYNSLIEGIDALDEAERSGGTKRLKNKERMMEAFKIMRADLICALRIEKTFRENPKLRSTDFNMNLEPLKIVQMSEEASQYGDLFGQALQIGMSVQEEMQALQKKP
ncbi:hypothetical protein PMG71_13615 [Roseofilum sp. BLCC_M154]|uniref:Uncharacterized protein n=1 Tax=Roseofilum acuticapitatum BLCC-M154 TaxID=3022444 RepID=A0ABT7AU98_9CYAN|nr:hypothetical protein [Roseofilum acuticapitatum]MDJ1170469.1 hypothetical protein [Roseofilum acuticapitatum BLCC-M154]